MEIWNHHTKNQYDEDGLNACKYPQYHPAQYLQVSHFSISHPDFIERNIDELGWIVDTRNPPQTDLEQQAVFEVKRLGIAPHGYTRERHLVLKLSHALIQEQAAKLHKQKGTSSTGTTRYD